MSTVIEISGLTKKYGSNKAVNDISFSVSKGEILGFLGPNGAGKSTTMNILTGYLSKTSGKVSVCGFDILENPKEAKKRIGYLPEQPPIYTEMTPGEYLDFVCDLKGVKEFKAEHTEAVMQKVGIDHIKNRLIRNLSKGYKQRVGLAGALIGNPEVLVLDEPTVGLDPTQIIEIRNVIKEIGKEKTVILSTHILQEVTAICDRVIIINHGKIVVENTLDNLSGTDSHTYELRIKGDRNRVNDLLRETDFIGSHIIKAQKEPQTCDIEIVADENYGDIREDIFNLFVNEGMVILSFKKKETTLEDIFVKATNGEYDLEEDEEETVEENEKKGVLEKIKGIFVKKDTQETDAKSKETENGFSSEEKIPEIREDNNESEDEE